MPANQAFDIYTKKRIIWPRYLENSIEVETFLSQKDFKLCIVLSIN